LASETGSDQKGERKGTSIAQKKRGGCRGHYRGSTHAKGGRRRIDERGQQVRVSNQSVLLNETLATPQAEQAQNMGNHRTQRGVKEDIPKACGRNGKKRGGPGHRPEKLHKAFFARMSSGRQISESPQMKGIGKDKETPQRRRLEGSLRSFASEHGTPGTRGSVFDKERQQSRVQKGGKKKGETWLFWGRSFENQKGVQMRNSKKRVKKKNRKKVRGAQ